MDTQYLTNTSGPIRTNRKWLRTCRKLDVLYLGSLNHRNNVFEVALVRKASGVFQEKLFDILNSIEWKSTFHPIVVQIHSENSVNISETITQSNDNITTWWPGKDPVSILSSTPDLTFPLYRVFWYVALLFLCLAEPVWSWILSFLMLTSLQHAKQKTYAFTPLVIWYGSFLNSFSDSLFVRIHVHQMLLFVFCWPLWPLTLQSNVAHCWSLSLKIWSRGLRNKLVQQCQFFRIRFTFHLVRCNSISDSTTLFWWRC